MYAIQVLIDDAWEHVNTGDLHTWEEATATAAKLRIANHSYQYQIVPPEPHEQELKQVAAEQSAMRDEFAQTALLGIMKGLPPAVYVPVAIVKSSARLAYEYADAMLEARKVNHQTPKLESTESE